METNPLNNPLSQSRRRWALNGSFDQWEGKLTVRGDRDMSRYEQARSIAQQVAAIEHMVATYPDQPWALARQAELYSRLDDSFGALMVARRAVAVLQKLQLPDDVTFTQWMQTLEGEVSELDAAEEKSYQNCLEYMYPTPDVTHLSKYETAPVQKQELYDRWQKIRNEVSDDIFSRHLARLMAIETSQLEDVFRLGGTSVHRLVRAGFFITAIEKFENDSSLHDKHRVVRILQDYQKALRSWATVWTEHKALDSVMIFEVHQCLLQSTRVRDDKTSSYIIPTRCYRRKVVNAYGTIPTLFHRPANVEASMQCFFALAEPIIAAARTRQLDDPYTAAAWMHHCLLSIHPFLDGNGRMTRIISSIPLVLCGLPPINIFNDDRRKYKDALVQADRKLDLRPLANFLYAQANKTCDKLLQINEEPFEDIGDDLDTFTMDEWRAATATGPVSLSD